MNFVVRPQVLLLLLLLLLLSLLVPWLLQGSGRMS
jgi:hypothetical protein